jgi:hypothetical protein
MATPIFCTEHCQRFLVALQELCDAYDVYLTTHDDTSIQIWTRLPGDQAGFDPEAITDCTDCNVP